MGWLFLYSVWMYRILLCAFQPAGYPANLKAGFRTSSYFLYTFAFSNLRKFLPFVYKDHTVYLAGFLVFSVTK